jgi:hypothetical protein
VVLRGFDGWGVARLEGVRTTYADDGRAYAVGRQAFVRT